MPFQDGVDCVVNNEKVHLTKKDLAYLISELKNWFTQQNNWLAIALIASFIGILRFVIAIIMGKKWFGVRNAVTTINTPVSKVAKQQAEAISLFSTISGG